jgi:tetratricopeptide (TPR) repeat protein
MADFNKRAWDKAIHDFNKVIQINPTNALAYEYRGCAFFLNGDTDKAINDFTQAIQLSPTNSRVYFNRGGAYRAQYKFDKAIRDYSFCLQLEPTNHLAYNSRAACFSCKHESGKSINDWNEGLRLNPNDSTALACRGGEYFTIGQFDKAALDFYQAIKIAPTNSLAYDWLAWLRATCPVDSMRNGKEAVEAATKACELTNWRHGNWIDTLAAAYAEVGDFEKAVKYQKQAMASKDVKDLSDDARKEFQHRLSLYKQKKPDHNGQKE